MSSVVNIYRVTQNEDLVKMKPHYPNEIFYNTETKEYSLPASVRAKPIYVKAVKDIIRWLAKHDDIQDRGETFTVRLGIETYAVYSKGLHRLYANEYRTLNKINV